MKAVDMGGRQSTKSGNMMKCRATLGNDNGR